jgi:hypothetical protein
MKKLFYGMMKTRNLNIGQGELHIGTVRKSLFEFITINCELKAEKAG